MAEMETTHGFGGETQADILEALKANPGMIYVASGQRTMYTHWGEDVMLCFVGDFLGMSDEDINAYIQKSLKAVQKAVQNE